MGDGQPSGALLLDKPTGITSARAVSLVKRSLPRPTKVGHTGTLDPLASGLLVVVVGRSTRLSRYVTDLDKSYLATARFGATSDTLDADGTVTELEAPMPDEPAIRAALTGFTGKLLQLPPMASAVKIGGERLYNLHRRGVEVEREARPVTVHSLELKEIDPAAQTATFEISCSSGTYVRTLLADLAHSLGTGAYLTALRRTRVGEFTLGDAARIEELSPDTVKSRIILPERLLSRLPVVEVGEEQARAVANGRPLRVEGVEGDLRIEKRGGGLLAVYRADGGIARAEVVLCGG